MLSDIRCSFPLANEAKARPPPAAARSLLAGEGRCLLARCGPPVPGGAQARSSRTHLRSRGQRFMPNIHQAHPTISVADNAPVLRALPAPCLPGQAACNSLCPNTQKLCAPLLARIACAHSNMGRGNKEHARGGCEREGELRAALMVLLATATPHTGPPVRGTEDIAPHTGAHTTHWTSSVRHRRYVPHTGAHTKHWTSVHGRQEFDASLTQEH